MAGLGDHGTTCAIVGGIVALATGVEGIPVAWRATREGLDLREREGTNRQPTLPDQLVLMHDLP